MSSETSRIALCTGRFFSLPYVTSPNARPAKQTRRPAMRRERPVIPRKVTEARSGRMSSDSSGRAGGGGGEAGGRGGGGRAGGAGEGRGGGGRGGGEPQPSRGLSGRRRKSGHQSERPFVDVDQGRLRQGDVPGRTGDVEGRGRKGDSGNRGHGVAADGLTQSMTMPMFTFLSPLPLLRTMSISLIASSYLTVSSAEKKTTLELRLRRTS